MRMRVRFVLGVMVTEGIGILHGAGSHGAWKQRGKNAGTAEERVYLKKDGGYPNYTKLLSALYSYSKIRSLQKRTLSNL